MLKLLKSKSFLVVASSTLLCSLVYIGNQSSASNSYHWNKIGSGNLLAMDEGEKTYLLSNEALYINMLGIEGKEPALLTETAYEYEHKGKTKNIKKINTVAMKYSPGKGAERKYLKSENSLFPTNPGMKKKKTGELVYSDSTYENIWTLDSNGKSTPLLDTNGYEEAKKIVNSYGNLDEGFGEVVWAANVNLASDDTIFFQSNRDNVKSKDFSLSVYKTTNGKDIKKVLDSKKYNQGIRLFDVKGNKALGYIPKGDIIVAYDNRLDTTKEYIVNGHPEALSPDGNFLLFRKVEDDVVQKDFYLLELNSGEERYFGMPDGYFFNGDGAWSEDSTKYAYYLNGLNGNDATKSYRTNIKIGVLDIVTGEINIYEKPSESSNLYTLGAISWIDNNTVIATTDDNNSWELIIE